MMFNFYLPCKILSGVDSFNDIGKICSDYGRKFLLVTYDFMLSYKHMEVFSQSFEKFGLKYTVFADIKGEPTVDTISQAVSAGRSYGVDAVIAIGGGSVIDTAKAAAGMIVNDKTIVNYLEGVGDGSVMSSHPLPFIVVPTTAGTGAEVTKNAVISDKASGYKKSFRDERLFAKQVIIDPKLHIFTPKKTTAHSGMDALTQLIESVTSIKATPFSKAIAMQGLYLIKSLKKAYDNGDDISAREDMAIAATMSGVALATGGLGAAHGVAAALGIHLDLPHGLACAIMLPHIVQLNSAFCIKDYAEVAQVLIGEISGSDNLKCQKLIDYIKELNLYFNIPENLKGFGLNDAQIKSIARDSFGSSMSGNPVKLSEGQLFEFLKSIS